MSALLIVLFVALILVVIIQISKASEYVSILKGKEKSQAQANKVNATLLILFLIFGLIAVYICHEALKGKLLPEPASSVQGQAIDRMIWVTLAITGFVFIVTQVALFYFAWRYRARPGHKATFFPQHSPKHDRLEIVWTSVTLLVLLVLIVWGLKEWFKITGPAPKDAMVMEVTGKQFTWFFRYPGKDGELGRKDYKLIDAAKSNPLGQDWTDKANDDDIVAGEMHLVVNKPVKLIINSQDVVHDVGMPYFRLKMDAVPGLPTTLWFTPTFTTAQMIKKTGDPDFVYELACDQLCGNGHYSMRAVIIVQTQQEFDKWEASQKPQYQIAMESNAPAPADSMGTKAPADSSSITVAGAAPKGVAAR